MSLPEIVLPTFATALIEWCFVRFDPIDSFLRGERIALSPTPAV